MSVRDREFRWRFEGVPDCGRDDYARVLVELESKRVKVVVDYGRGCWWHSGTLLPPDCKIRCWSYIPSSPEATDGE